MYYLTVSENGLAGRFWDMVCRDTETKLSARAASHGGLTGAGGSASEKAPSHGGGHSPGSSLDVGWKPSFLITRTSLQGSERSSWFLPEQVI